MTTNNNNETLTTKIAHMSAKVGRIAKSGKNSGFGESYNFIEYSVVAGKLRDLFDEYKVIIYPAIESFDCQEVTSSKGKAGYHYLLSMKFTVVNGENQEDKMECSWVGESTDYGDKGVNKAITAATKYFIMRLLQVSEKGDEDPDSVTPEPRQVQSKPETSKGIDFEGYRNKCAGMTLDELRKEYVLVNTNTSYSDKQKEALKKIINEVKDSK